MPLVDTFWISRPSNSFGDIWGLMDLRTAPTLVSGVVVIRRSDFCRGGVIVAY